MRTYNKVTPEGTKDLLFEECLIHRAVERKLTAVFAARGFHEVVTPGMEFMDVFDPEVSGIAPEIMYKMSDRRGRLIVMRPDSTMPIARLAATRLQKEEKPLRLYYTQRIYRNHPNLTGRSDEVLQAGVELLGAGGKRADLEAICTAVESLSSCTPDFRLELGHAGFFRAIADGLPITADQREEIRSLIESKNYAALESLLDGLERTPAVEAMRRLPRLFGGEEVFAQAAPLCGSEEAAAMLEYLHSLYKSLSALGLGNRLMVDLGLVQRNDYYTGIREAEQRRQLHGTLDLDDVHVHAAAFKERAGHGGIFCGDGAGGISAPEVGALRGRQREPAAAEAQIQHLIKRSAVLHDRILADDAHVAHAVLHIGDDVRRLGQHNLQPVPHRENQAAALVPHSLAIVADAIQEGHGVLLQSAFRQGNPQRLHA